MSEKNIISFSYFPYINGIKFSSIDDHFNTFGYAPKTIWGVYTDERYLYPDWNFEMVMDAECLLFQLDVIETIKYGSALVYSKSAIYNYSINRFDLAFVRERLIKSMNSWASSKKGIRNIEFLSREDSLNGLRGIALAFDKYQTPETQQIKKHRSGQNPRSQEIPDRFLRHIYEHIKGYFPFDIIGTHDSYDEPYQSSKDHLTPLIQIPEMLLLYAFYSGRKYSSKSNRSKTYSTHKTMCSEDAYHESLFRLNSYYSFDAESEIIHSPLNILHKYRLEKIFHFNQITQLVRLYNFFHSDDFKDSLLILRYKNSSHINELDADIDSEIFNDKEFIKKLLSCQLINPVYFAEYRYHVLIKQWKNSYTYYYKDVRNALNKIKIEIIDYISRVPLYLSLYHLVLSDTAEIDVNASEKQILQYIDNNPVAKEFLITKNSINDINDTLEKIKEFCSYSDLKNIVINNSNDSVQKIE